MKSFKNSSVIVCLYVDDLLILGPNLDVINTTKKLLNSKFDMKDMGRADVILGIRILKNEKKLHSDTISLFGKGAKEVWSL